MIRQVKEKDIKNISSLILDYLNSHPEYRPKEEDLRTAIKACAKKEDPMLFVITNDMDTAMGYINLHIIDFPLLSGKELYISELFVDSQRRNEKLGTSLLDFAKEKAKELGCNRLMLNNSMESIAYERDFYKKHGFVHRNTMANFVLNIE